MEVTEARPAYGGHPSFGGTSRFEREPANGFQSGYTTPGWQRAQKQWQSEGGQGSANKGGHKEKWANKRGPVTLEGELVASSTVTSGEFPLGERVFHQKYGYGEITEVDGNKRTVEFEKSGAKKVLESFLEKG